MATNQWVNNDGLIVHFGRGLSREVNQNFGPVEFRGLRYMIMDWAYDKLPTFTADLDNDGTLDGFTEEDAFIPSGSLITSAWTLVKTAFAGGTSYEMGLYQKDGTVIDAGGIDTGVLTAALAANLAVINNGALVGGTGLVTANAYPVFAATGTFTAGEARTVIEFVSP